MSLLKVPLIFSDALGMRITGRPPNTPLPSVQHIVPDWKEHFLKSLAWPCVLLRALSWTVEIVETIVIVASHNASHPLAHRILSFMIFHHRAPLDICITITPLFLLGNLLTLVGTLLRLSCYRALGRLFTFELSIQRDHRLITHGPYAFIRHPSYTGMMLTIAGAICSHAGAGSWVVQSGFMETVVGRVLVGYWVAVAVAVMVSLCLRIPGEDEMLRGRFGEEWVRWRERVPYRLIPGIY